MAVNRPAATTTLEVADTPAVPSSSFTNGGQKLNETTLPEPDGNMQGDEIDEAYQLVDLILGAALNDREEPENDIANIARVVFPGRGGVDGKPSYYVNTDDLLEHYRESLRLILRTDNEQRSECYDLLEKSIHWQAQRCKKIPHSKAICYQPVKAELLHWAEQRFPGPSPESFYDEDGSVRPRNTEPDGLSEQRGYDEDASMVDATVVLPEPLLARIRPLWEQAREPVTIFIEQPRKVVGPKFLLYDAPYIKKIDEINESIKQATRDANFSDIELTIDWRMMLLTLMICTDGKIHADAQAAGGETSTQHRTQQHLDMWKARVERACMPIAWADHMQTAIDAKTTRWRELVHAGKNPHAARDLWPKDAVHRLQSAPIRRVDAKNENQAGQAEVKPAGPAASGYANPKPQLPSLPMKEAAATHATYAPGQRPAVPAGGSSTSPGPLLQASARNKGFVKVRLQSDTVPYLGRQCKIGAARLVHQLFKNDAYQLFVQISTDDAAIKFWHIVPSSEFDKGVIARYLKLEDSVALGEIRTKPPKEGHDHGKHAEQRRTYERASAWNAKSRKHRGTADELEDTDLEDFEFGGIAVIPRKPENGVKNLMTFVFGMVNGGTPKFWDRSTIGRCYRQKAVDEVFRQLMATDPTMEMYSPMRQERRTRSFQRSSDVPADDEYIRSRRPKANHATAYKQELRRRMAELEAEIAAASESDGEPVGVSDDDSSVLDYADQQYYNEGDDDFIAEHGSFDEPPGHI